MTAQTSNDDQSKKEEKVPALEMVLKRRQEYDTLAKSKKKVYIWVRIWIILLSLTASLLAISTTFMEDDSNLLTMTKLILISIPIISLSLMDYSRRISTDTDWLKYRFTTEYIRSKTYLFRMAAREYSGKNEEEMSTELLRMIRRVDEIANLLTPVDISKTTKVRRWVQWSMDAVGFIIKSPSKVQELFDWVLKESTPRTDAVSGEFGFDKYIEERLQGQMDWYTRRITADYIKERRANKAIIALAILGSILAGMGGELVVFVAVTTAAATALTMFSDTLMFGATYKLFQQAKRNLENSKATWDSLSSKNQTEDKQKELVIEIEWILSDERVKWQDRIIELQEKSERAILNALNQQGPEDTAVKQSKILFDDEIEQKEVPNYAKEL
jgi:hypothetical protein